VRFVLASTSEVYGDPQAHPQPEDYWGHVNTYGRRMRAEDGRAIPTFSASPIEYVERPVDDPQVRRPDTSLAERLLGWRPRVSWQGLADTVEWFADAARRTA
jgi:dTDP-glucose 4,6-dehydratase